MVTVDTLKQALRAADAETTISTKPLSDADYAAGFALLYANLADSVYKPFIIPQLAALLTPLCDARPISVLEVGPGPRSVLADLPESIRGRIRRYRAFEPNAVFARDVGAGVEAALTGLERPAEVVVEPFGLEKEDGGAHDGERFDAVLFCHSLYGLKPRDAYVRRALDLLDNDDGLVVVFHRGESVKIDRLACVRSARLARAELRIDAADGVLDTFCSFIAGSVAVDEVMAEKRKTVARELGRQCDDSKTLAFASPSCMVAFPRRAAQKMDDLVPVLGDRAVKNREAVRHTPATMVSPQSVEQVQACVRWALETRASLTVVGGGHGGACVWPNTVAVNMSSFDSVKIVESSEAQGPVVVVGGGCTSGAVISATMAAGLSLPLGSRPSVGAGLWLQGGVGHLSRLHGLACDRIIGAVMVSVATGDVLILGNVPATHQPTGSIRPANEAELLWGIKGAGSNLGIVISAVFNPVPAVKYSVRSWLLPIADGVEPEPSYGELTIEQNRKYAEFMRSQPGEQANMAGREIEWLEREVAWKLPRNGVCDVYLYWEDGQLNVGVSLVEALGEDDTNTPFQPCPEMRLKFGNVIKKQTVDAVGLFDTDMYLSGMHGGHAGGKTSSFKRCVFLRDIGLWTSRVLAAHVADAPPSKTCYIHLLHGGGAIGHVRPEESAFGCRGWDYACVVTAVWPRDQDGTDVAAKHIDWVYNLVNALLSTAAGSYGADLGPDPRDAALARKAFGPNADRLGRLKRVVDPQGVLPYACPLPSPPRVAPKHPPPHPARVTPRLIVLVTGPHGAGKDFVAAAWAGIMNGTAVSISDVMKKEYAEATGADLARLMNDRGYKEQHRGQMTRFFEEQLQKRPRLREEHFLDVVHAAPHGREVFFITGMRDEAPVASFGHLVPGARLIEVRVDAVLSVRQARRGGVANGEEHVSASPGWPDWKPDYIFDNSAHVETAAMSDLSPIRQFATRNLLPLLSPDLDRLAGMAHPVDNFPQRGVTFRHVLGIAQHECGLDLCASLIRARLLHAWNSVSAIVACETSGFVFAPMLAMAACVPLVLVRDGGKLPPPVVSASRGVSHASRMDGAAKTRTIEMAAGVVGGEGRVVVVDDVLATGETLCAVLELLGKAGVAVDRVDVLVVAEFPAHRGREMLRKRGWGRVVVASLLVFEGL